MLTTAPVILVAEDDPAVRALLLEVLVEEGYTVESARDAAGVWARLEGEDIGLLLIDVLMPGEDGLTIIQQVVDTRPSVPIVAMSASDGHLAEALAVGADATLAKPFGLDDLLAVVASYCRRDVADPPPGESPRLGLS
jgi:CheY-like chemotaxis protein